MRHPSPAAIDTPRPMDPRTGRLDVSSGDSRVYDETPLWGAWCVRFREPSPAGLQRRYPGAGTTTQQSPSVHLPRGWISPRMCNASVYEISRLCPLGSSAAGFSPPTMLRVFSRRHNLLIRSYGAARLPRPPYHRGCTLLSRSLLWDRVWSTQGSKTVHTVLCVPPGEPTPMARGSRNTPKLLWLRQDTTRHAYAQHPSCRFLVRARCQFLHLQIYKMLANI
jgi:hypothetical protein